MWRLGYDNPADFNDHQVTQHRVNMGIEIQGVQELLLRKPLWTSIGCTEDAHPTGITVHNRPNNCS